MHRRMTVLAPPKADAKLVTKFVVYLKSPSLWLGDGPNPRWVERKDQAERFRTFAEADAASDGYNVIIKTVEEFE